MSRSVMRSSLRLSTTDILGRCFAVTLAMAWYLLVPPMAGSTGVNTTVPVEQWSKAGVYNSQQECELAKGSFRAVIARNRGSGDQTQALLAVERSNCVAADDYRLEAAAQAQANQAGGSTQNPAGAAQVFPSTGTVYPGAATASQYPSAPLANQFSNAPGMSQFPGAPRASQLFGH